MATNHNYGFKIGDDWACRCELQHSRVDDECEECGYSNPWMRGRDQEQEEGPLMDMGVHNLTQVVSRETTLPAKADYRYRTDQVKFRLKQMTEHAVEVGRLLLEIEQHRDWEHLGYSSWTQYLKNEFEQARGTLYRAMQQARVQQALGEPVTQREAAVYEQQQRELENVSAYAKLKPVPHPEDEQKPVITTHRVKEEPAQAEGVKQPEIIDSYPENQAGATEEEAAPEVETVTIMRHVCGSCGSLDIVEQFEDGRQIPAFVGTLRREIPKIQKVKWLEDWTVDLTAWWDGLAPDKKDPIAAEKVAMSLISYKNKYKQYYMTYKNWYMNEISRNGVNHDDADRVRAGVEEAQRARRAAVIAEVKAEQAASSGT